MVRILVAGSITPTRDTLRPWRTLIGSGPLQRVVIVGASLAGLNAAETLRAEGYEADRSS